MYYCFLINGVKKETNMKIKKLLALIGVLGLSTYASAIVVPEAAVAEANKAHARSTGMSVYTECILIPPLTRPQEVACEAKYEVYNAALAVATAPAPMVKNPFPSPYMISPYDICRYEVSVLIFPADEGIPVCPSF